SRGRRAGARTSCWPTPSGSLPARSRLCDDWASFHHSSTESVAMSVKRLNAGPRMSGAVVHNNTVYLAGQVADGPDVKSQTEAVLKKIDELLGAAGSSKANLLSTV